MRRGTMLAIFGLGLFVLGVIAANTGMVQGVIPVTPYEADINKDGAVNSGDQLGLAKNYGLPVPTATPQPTTPVIVRDRQFVTRIGAEPDMCCALIDTDDGSIVATFNSSGEKQSCDGRYSYIHERDAVGQSRVAFIDMETGSVVVSSTPFPSGYNVEAWFSCPLIPGSPPDRAVLTVRNVYTSPPLKDLTIWNLTSGEALAHIDIDDSPVALNCGLDVVMFTDVVTTNPDPLIVRRLSDGLEVGRIPGGTSLGPLLC